MKLGGDFALSGAIQVLRNAGGGRCLIFWKKRYEDVLFNVISVTRGWVGVQFPEKLRYVTLEWPLNLNSIIMMLITTGVALIFKKND